MSSGEYKELKQVLFIYQWNSLVSVVLILGLLINRISDFKIAFRSTGGGNGHLMVVIYYCIAIAGTILSIFYFKQRIGSLTELNVIQGVLSGSSEEILKKDYPVNAKFDDVKSKPIDYITGFFVVLFIYSMQLKPIEKLYTYWKAFYLLQFSFLLFLIFAISFYCLIFFADVAFWIFIRGNKDPRSL